MLNRKVVANLHATSHIHNRCVSYPKKPENWMKLKNLNLKLSYFGILVLLFLVSCNNGDYLQKFEHYDEFSKIENPRLTGWFPVELIKSDAHNIKNISYLSTKCVFGVFDYENEELYDSILIRKIKLTKLTLEFSNRKLN